MNCCLNVYLIRLSQHTEARTPEQTKGLGAVSENILSDRNRKHILGAKMCFTKSMIL